MARHNRALCAGAGEAEQVSDAEKSSRRSTTVDRPDHSRSYGEKASTPIAPTTAALATPSTRDHHTAGAGALATPPGLT